MARRKRSAVPEYEFLGIEVKRFVARIDSSINHELRDKRYRNEKTSIYSFHSYLEVEGVTNYPDDRAGERYALTIYGGEREEGELSSRLSDYRVYDDDHVPKTRKVRGEVALVYDEPKSIGYLDRQYRSKDWRGAVWVSPATVADMLTLLPHVRPIFVQVHVQRVDRKRRIIGLTLQTSNPAEE